MTSSIKCSPAKKSVYVTRYANGFGWGKRNVVDVVHDCILARYLGAGVNDPSRVLEFRIGEEIEMEESELFDYSSAISHLDNTEGEDIDLQRIRKLAKKLGMRVLVLH